METELSKETLSRITFYKYLSLLILHYNRYPVLAVSNWLVSSPKKQKITTT